MKKNESADQTRPAPSPGLEPHEAGERVPALPRRQPAFGAFLVWRLVRLVPGREDGLFALFAEAALQLGRPLLRQRLPPVERVLRGGLEGPEREALRDGARVAHEAAARVGALGRGPDGQVAPFLDLLRLQERRAPPT